MPGMTQQVEPGSRKTVLPTSPPGHLQAKDAMDLYQGGLCQSGARCYGGMCLCRLPGAPALFCFSVGWMDK